MKLLMITRKVDLKDASPAGFTYNWVKKIGEKLEKLYVITWQKSDRSGLPQNIEIISLSDNKFFKIIALQFKLLKILPKVNGIFCHQNPEYTILAASCAKLFGKKIVTWYAHGSINWKLYLAYWLTDKLITSSEKGCRLKNRKKIKVIGQGIDIDCFKPKQEYVQRKEKIRILSVGRISPVKDYETLVRAVNILIEQGIKNLEAEVCGGVGLKSHKKYFNYLKHLVESLKLESKIKFLGPVPHNQLLGYYQDCDLFISPSQTGSLDKTVLEAMACQKLVLTCNDAFIEIFNDSRMIFEKKNAQNLAQKIVNLINLSKKEKQIIGQRLRREIVQNHNLDNLIIRIIGSFRKMSG